MKRKIPAPEAGGFSKPVSSPSVLRVMCIVAAIQLGWTVMVLAQTPVDGQKAVTVASQLRDQRTRLSERIAELTSLAASIQSTEGQPATVAASAELKSLRSLDLIYLAHQTVIEQTSEALTERDRLQEELSLIRATKDLPGQTCSWLLFDDYRDLLDGEVLRAKSRAIELSDAQRAMEAALQEQDRVDRNRRQVLDEAAAAAAGGKGADGEYRLRIVDLEATMARATVDLRRAELALKKAEQQAAEQRRSLLQVRIERMRAASRLQ